MIPRNASRSFALLTALAILVAAGGASAKGKFLYSGEPIHPGCIHALAMQQGDASPVTAAVSLEGCAASARSRAKVRWESDDLAMIEDDALLGGGAFGYRVLSQLDNGIYGLAIRRVLPDGKERVSLAAVEIVERPMIRHGNIVQLQLVELLGELWIPGMDLTSFRTVGNRVHFIAGFGNERVERDVDLTRLGKMRRQRTRQLDDPPAPPARPQPD
jgi:hypothetical protein